ncbi:MAG: hypothetical protein K2W95_26435 [Candidatus Obscuribacterales bacterium]|nr:hypothetical protein [Candidatus Obscuribacterales bacterium]
MTKKSPEILVGDLLVKSGVIDRSDLADALPISLKTGLPVGRILITSGNLKETTLQAALFAQSMVRDCLLTEDMAVQALRLLDKDGVSLDDALAKLGWKSDAYELTNRLGQLFLEADIITEEELVAGLEGFYTAGLPLARILVIQGVLHNEIAFAALSAQRLIRDGLITRDQAIEALRSANENSTSLEESLSVFGYLKLHPDNTIRLGELLVLAGLATEEELLENVERSLSYEEYIGETFVNSGRIAQSVLDSALELQRLATAGVLEPRQAAESLRRIAITGMTVGEAVTEATGTSEQRAQLLGLQREEPYATPHPSPLIEDFEDQHEADSAPGAAPSVPQQRPSRPQSKLVSSPANAVPGGQREVADEDTLAPYLMALQKMVKGQMRKRKRKKSQTQAVDSALITMAELQTSIPRDSGVLSRQHLKLISKMMTRIEELSYKAGYLEGCIDAANTESSANVLEEIYPVKSQPMEFASSVEAPGYHEGDRSLDVLEQKASNSLAHTEQQPDKQAEITESHEGESMSAEGVTDSKEAGAGQSGQSDAKKSAADNSRMSKKKRKRMMMMPQA